MKASAKKVCFVLMPFGQPFDAYYKEIFVPAIKRAGLKPVRADEIKRSGVIVNQIWANINEAVVLVAELTDQNPNVMYELGLAHAIGRPVVQVMKKDAKDIPFDLKHLRHVMYDTQEPNWAEKLGKELEDFLQETMREPGQFLLFAPMEPSATVSEPAAEHVELGEDEITILKAIAKMGDHGYTAVDLSNWTTMNAIRIGYHLDKLKEAKFLRIPFGTSMGAAYKLDQKAREYLVERNLI